MIIACMRASVCMIVCQLLTNKDSYYTFTSQSDGEKNFLNPSVFGKSMVSYFLTHRVDSFFLRRKPWILKHDHWSLNWK